MLDIHQDEALVFDGEHYNKIEVPYYKEFDTKIKNVPIFVRENVEKTCEKEEEKFFCQTCRKEVKYGCDKCENGHTQMWGLFG
jgi:hypothetical protein